MPETHITWRFDEWEKVYSAARAYFDHPTKPSNVIQAVRKAQIILPKSRRRPLGAFTKRAPKILDALQSHMARRKKRGLPSFEEMAKLTKLAETEETTETSDETKTQKAADIVPIHQAAPDTQKTPTRHLVRWTTKEQAIVVREADRLMREAPREYHGKPWKPYQYLLLAQQSVLPLERQRTRNSIGQSYQKGMIDAVFATGRAYAWTLPPATPAAAPLSSEVPQERADTPTIAPPTAAAPTPATPAPAQARLRDAITGLLSAHAEYLLGEQLRPLLTGLLDDVERRIAAQLSDVRDAFATGLHAQVHTLLEKELGPVHAPSAAASAPQETPAPLVPAGEESRPPKILLDVVGLLPGQARIVASGIPDNYDIRFLTPEEVRKGSIRQKAIIAAKFVSHSVEERYKSVNARIVRVNGGPHSVIEAMQNAERWQSEAH
jgi:hypothetical protein